MTGKFVGECKMQNELQPSVFSLQPIAILASAATKCDNTVDECIEIADQEKGAELVFELIQTYAKT